MHNLPIEIRDFILDMAGTEQYWKHRFSTDVLSQIDKYYRPVGIFCRIHGEEPCQCDRVKFVPCANCYCYGYSICYHLKYDTVPFEDVREHCRIVIKKNRFIPMEVFNHFFVCDVDEWAPYDDRGDVFLKAKEATMWLIKAKAM